MKKIEFTKKTNHRGHGVSRRKKDFRTKNSVLSCRTALLRGFLLVFTVALTMISCEKRALPAALLPPPSEPETQAVYAEPETTDAEETEEMYESIEEYLFPRRIIIPYTKEYLSPGQETIITALLENGSYDDDMYFEFTQEPGKSSIAVDSINNVAVIKAVREGVQYLCISHPKAQESRYIYYDVLPPSPPPPPELDVSESPLILRKGETKPLRLILRNSKAAAATGGFQFQVVENAYALEVRQQGDTLHITGIAPGAGKIRVQHPAALRDYDVMVIVD